MVNRVPSGAVVTVEPGLYKVHLHIDKPLTLKGEKGAVLDGQGSGNVVLVQSRDVTIEGLTIRNSGTDLTTMNAGIFVDRKAGNVTIRNNFLDHNLFGVWLDGGADADIEDNRVRGIPTLRSQDRGNGIHLHNTTGTKVFGNEIWETRDGIYIETSNKNVLKDNYMHDLRYGIHYMYSNHNYVTGNRTHHTRTGYALMESDHLYIEGNRSDGDLNYGILMNYITYSDIAGNIVKHVRPGLSGAIGGAPVEGAEGKALFVYNCQYDDIHDNVFADSDIGIHVTAGSQYDTIYGNAFIGNRTQVKYVSTRPQEWSHDGRGNYWSDYLGWDLDNNGIGDRPYEPVDGVDRLLWKYPLAKVLMHSPAVDTLHWVQAQFPVLQAKGVKDSYPLMVAPTHGKGQS